MDAESVASVVEIQQLACRYSLAVDSRDLDLLASLFIPDVVIGRAARGRDALKRWYGDALRTVGATIHMVANHTVELNADGATGVVYCREEVEHPATGEWHVGMLQYWDDYRRVDGRWLFERRRVRRWYSTDALARPQRNLGVTTDGPGAKEVALPEAFPTWALFSESEGGTERA
jgi:hypothetical protein